MSVVDRARALPKNERRMWVFGTVAITAMIAVIVWINVAATIGKPMWGNLGFDVPDERHVVVQYQLTRPTDKTVVCSVVAKEMGHATVGRTEDVIPPGPDRELVRTVTVRTTAQAVMGEVRQCRARD